MKTPAQLIVPLARNARERVHMALRMFGPMTDEEIQGILRMGGSTQRPRRLELQQAGRVVAGGKVKSGSGRKATLWKAA
jgi:hypothetical protein